MSKNSQDNRISVPFPEDMAKWILKEAKINRTSKAFVIRLAIAQKMAEK